MNYPRIRALALSLALLAVLVAACSPAAVTAPQGKAETITVTGFGRAYGDPDMAQITIGVSIADEDVGAAVAESNRVMEALTEQMASMGLDEADIQTVNFSIWGEEQWDPETGQPREERLYRVDSTLQLTVRQIDNLGEILEAAIDNGANNIHGLSFSMQDPEALVDEARSDAVQDARRRAELLAAELGVSLGDVVLVEEASGGSAFPMFESGVRGIGGGGEPPISEGSMSVSSSVHVTFEFTR